MAQLTPQEVEAIEQRVDKAFLKVTGQTYREPPGDSLDKIMQDFPALFKE